MMNADLSYRKVFAAYGVPSLDSSPAGLQWDELHANKKSVVRAMKAVVDKASKEGRDLTAEEAAAYDIGVQVAEAVNSELETRSMNGNKGPRAVGARTQPGVGPGYAPSSGGHDAFAAPSKLTAFANAESAHAAGKWVQAQLLGDPQAAQWCTDRGMQIQAAASEGINTAGGFLVPQEMSTAIIALMNEYGVARKECRVLQMGSDTMTIPRRTGGLTPYFVGENTAGTESQTTWDNITLSAKKLMILTRMSSELAEDSIISMADWLAQEIAYAFAQREDECLFNGTGATTYGGMVGIRPKLVTGTMAGAMNAISANADTFGELALIDLTTLMSLVPQYAIRGSKWYCSQVAWSLVFERLIAAGGGNAVVDMTGSIPKRFLGYEVIVSESMPNSTGTLDNVAMILFGNMRQSVTFGDRRQIRLLTSRERYMDLDQVGILGTTRFDLNAHDLGDATTAGPIVGLIGKA